MEEGPSGLNWAKGDDKSGFWILEVESGAKRNVAGASFSRGRLFLLLLGKKMMPRGMSRDLE